MNFKEAKEKLEKIADGRYFSIGYRVSCNLSLIPVEQECSLYIDGRGWHENSTWERAFEELSNNKGIKEDLSDIKEIEDDK